MALVEKGSTSDSGLMPQNAVDGMAAGSFTGLVTALSDVLTVTEVPVSPNQSVATASGAVRKRLERADPDKQLLPGQPRIHLDEDIKILEYLRKNHKTDEVDGILPFMKYIFVQTPSFRHIAPLHHQASRGREILISEHPGLHLVWYYERIFIKPIPAYFYEKAFWEYLRDEDEDVFRAAVGFMRSWGFLVQYEVDFDLAVEKKLIPGKPGTERAPGLAGTPGPARALLPTYEEFSSFLAQFEQVTDAHVNRRYHYGELRLTRLNRTTLLARGKLAYFHIYPQWGAFLTHMLAPIITVFAVCSVVLNSMQVNLNALQLANPGAANDAPPPWNAFVQVSLYFPVAVMLAIAVVLGVAGAGFVVMGFKDLIWAKSVRHRKKHGDTHAGEKSHGMIW